ELFGKYRVYSERELQSRFNILCEGYVKTVNVEARLTGLMAKTMILPAALRYQAEVAQTVTATKAAGVDSAAQADLLRQLAGSVTAFQKATADLDHALATHSAGTPHAAGDAYA